MGILLHYTDLACDKIKTADWKFSWKFKIPACENFSTLFGAFHVEDWTFITISYGSTLNRQLLYPCCIVMQKKSIQISIFCHHHCPSAALTVECIPIIFNFLHSQSQSQTTQSEAQMYHLQSSIFKSQVNEFWWMTKEWNPNPLPYFPSQFFRKFLFITSS